MKNIVQIRLSQVFYQPTLKNTRDELVIDEGNRIPTAFVFINTEPVAMPDVLKQVKEIEGVEEAEMVYGVYDIVARVRTETMDQLKHIIAYRIRALAKVLKTQTLLVIP